MSTANLPPQRKEGRRPRLCQARCATSDSHKALNLHGITRARSTSTRSLGQTTSARTLVETT
jgi:hypothetical protein